MQVPIVPQRKGLTLIELSVTVSMITGLTSVLFMSAEYYKSAADRSSCITQIHAIQKAVRAHQNLNNLDAGDSITLDELVGENKPLPMLPTCPRSGGAYTLQTQIPAASTAFATCSEFDANSGTNDAEQQHSPTNLQAW